MYPHALSGALRVQTKAFGQIAPIKRFFPRAFPKIKQNQRHADKPKQPPSNHKDAHFDGRKCCDLDAHAGMPILSPHKGIAPTYRTLLSSGQPLALETM